jgi:hypothetical protein
MKNKISALCNETNDISKTASRAGIPYRTLASASLLARYAKKGEDEEGQCLWIIVWAVRSALAGVLECMCPPERHGEFDVYYVETLVPVVGKADPEPARILAALRREKDGRTTLLLALADPI